MRIRHGWSGEYQSNHWGKLDVSLGEEDVFRLLEEAGIDAATADLTTTEAYVLLNSEAQRLLIAGMMERYEYPAQQGKDEIALHSTHRKSVLDTVKARNDTGTTTS